MWDLFLPKHTNAYLKVENMPAIGFEIKRKCKVCGEVFLAKTLDSQYYSPKCSKVTVKLRKSVHHDNEWYLFIESYPVYKKGDNKPSRVVESVNRTISTPQWDMSSIARVLPDGSFNYKPKRDINGIIQCKSRIDQEACIYADNVRKLRQHEYEMPPCIPTVRKKSLNRMNVAHKTSLKICCVITKHDFFTNTKIQSLRDICIE